MFMAPVPVVTRDVAAYYASPAGVAAKSKTIAGEQRE